MEENQTTEAPEIKSAPKKTETTNKESNSAEETGSVPADKPARKPRTPRVPRKPKTDEDKEQTTLAPLVTLEVQPSSPKPIQKDSNTNEEANTPSTESDTSASRDNGRSQSSDEQGPRKHNNNRNNNNRNNNNRNNNNRNNNNRNNTNSSNTNSSSRDNTNSSSTNTNSRDNSNSSSTNSNSRDNNNNSHTNNNSRDNNKRRNYKDKSKPLNARYSDLIAEPEEIIRQKSDEFEIQGSGAFSVEELCYLLYKAMVEADNSGLSISKGILEILPDGYGFLREKICKIGTADVYISSAQIKRLQLRTGDFILGQTRAPKDNESYHALLRVELINDMDPDDRKKLAPFEKLVPLYPNQKFDLHTTAKDTSTRIIDMITPIGKGQRGLIVAPPKAGKTTLIKQIANALTTNHPELVLFVLLIDERPEEVTDMTRSIAGEVVASTFDQHLTNHIRVSEMVLERSKRMVEQGKDVVILLDSITRLARAYNIAIPSSGQTLSGGVNPLALYKPKKFFGSARNIEFGGSLTILATALVDTGSKMDEIIFEEFKGTGNMELHLDRQLFNKRVFPAINLTKSSTRREELLVDNQQLKGVNILRRVFETLSPQEAIDLLKKHMKQSKNNYEFLEQLQKQAKF